MTLDEAYTVLTPEEADQIGYMVASENREKAMIAAAEQKLRLEGKE